MIFQSVPLTPIRRLVAALLLAMLLASCAVLFAQDGDDDGIIYPGPNPCSEAVLRAKYGDDWHIWYALLGCWLISGDPSAQTIVLTDGTVIRRAVRVR